MNRRTLAAIAIAPAILLAAACSSSSSSSPGAHASTTTHPATVTGMEALTATVTGRAAAANFNSNSNAPLSFPSAVWTGPVSVTVTPFALPGNGNGAATVTLKTPSGNATVHHSANQAPGASNPNSPPPATWVKTGGKCYFTTIFSEGTVTFLSGTGDFAGATSSAPGKYLVTARGYAPLKPGQTVCSFTTTGNVEDSGAQIKFVASFPLTVKS